MSLEIWKSSVVLLSHTIDTIVQLITTEANRHDKPSATILFGTKSAKVLVKYLIGQMSARCFVSVSVSLLIDGVWQNGNILCAHNFHARYKECTNEIIEIAYTRYMSWDHFQMAQRWSSTTHVSYFQTNVFQLVVAVANAPTPHSSIRMPFVTTTTARSAESRSLSFWCWIFISNISIFTS